MSTSSVSGLLHEALAPEAQRAIFLPWIEAAFAEVFPYLSDVNKAHLLMLEEQGHLEPSDAIRLLRAIVEMAGEDPKGIPLDGSLEDIYFNYEAELIRRVGPELGGRLHTARSRNDLQSTLDRMRARDISASLTRVTLELREIILTRAEENLGTVMPGYTHLQHAQPVTFGWYLLGVEQSLSRDFARLSAASSRLNQCPLGAGALAGTTFRIDRERTASLLGFDQPVPHALDAVTAKDPILELLSSSLFLATTIGRLAQDFYQWSTFEFGMLDLPDNLAITSSMMPQKKNQAVLEFVKGRQASILGATVASFTAFHSKSYSHALDANAEGVAEVWGALSGLASLLSVVCLVVRGATPRPTRMAELANANFCTTTDLADLLVQSGGLPFREAHHVTGRTVRLALERGLSPLQVNADLVESAAREVLGRPIRLDERAIADAMNPMTALQRRVNCGGPSMHDSRVLLGQARQTLATDLTSDRMARRKIADAKRALCEAVEERLRQA
jgi:argininosuccinate lyase